MGRPWMDDWLQGEARVCSFVKATDGRPIEEALRDEPLFLPPFTIDGECDLHTEYRCADMDGWHHVEGSVPVRSRVPEPKEAER